VSFHKEWWRQKKTLLSIGLSTFETYAGIADCYCNSGENIFGDEDCENNLVTA
jgi:hypothetical protein